MKIDSINELKEKEKHVQSMEHVVSKGLMMPFNPSNSGSRKQMMAAQLEQLLGLYNPELPRVQTGYENSFGDRSSSLIISDREWVVIHKISKFSFDPNRFYYLIIYDPVGNKFDMVTRKEYEHITESYGILYNNDFLDKLSQGKKINKGNTIRKSLAYDEFNNRCDGVNLMSTYMSLEATKEDGIVISETAANLLASPLVKKVQFQINDNDIPLNLYARNNMDYKCFPDIGESTEKANGVLCALRRQKKDEILFTQSKKNLSRLMISDDKYTVLGTVVDIDIYCNNNETLENSYYYSQLNFYNKEKIRFMNEFVDKVEPLIKSNHFCSYELKKTYTDFRNSLEGIQYVKDNKLFSNVILEVTLVEKSPVKVGDKIANRYGGKGVVSEIRPDEMMPLLDNGKRVHLIYNSSTCINRENNGQLNEMFLNFASNRIIDHVNNLEEAFDLNYTINLYIDYLKILNPKLAQAAEDFILSGDIDDQTAYLSFLFDEGFILSLDPMSDNINIDILAKIKAKFPFIKQYNVIVPQRGSDGNYRYIQTRRTLECGEQYIWRLKQYAEEKISVVSLSATNLKNENTRNINKKSYKLAHAKTCVRFGDMETGDLLHAGVDAVITNLLLVSLAPKSRRKLGMELLEGPIFDTDIKLDDETSNRSVEILNAYLLTIGLKLAFIKVPKRLKYPIRYVRKSPLIYENPPKLRRPLIYEETNGAYTIPVVVGEDTLQRAKPKTRKILHYED